MTRRYKMYGEGVQLMGFHYHDHDWVPAKGERLECKYVRDEGIIALHPNHGEVGKMKKELSNLPSLKMLLAKGACMEAIVVRDVSKYTKKNGKSIVVEYELSVTPNLDLTEAKIENSLKEIISYINKKWKLVKMELMTEHNTHSLPSEEHDNSTHGKKRKRADNETEYVLQGNQRRKKKSKLCDVMQNLNVPHVRLNGKINANLANCLSGDIKVFFIAKLNFKHVQIDHIWADHTKSSERILEALQQLTDRRKNSDKAYLDVFMDLVHKSHPSIKVDQDWFKSHVLPNACMDENSS